ncbi:hypothetical protein BDF21DRAFT_425581 [Thamnidium elegans]|nr:hypothetical protein BDF21DRAFT_425581 [Thamnidium elegans]
MIPIPAAELNKTGIKKAEKAPTVPVAPVAVVVVEKKAARKKKGKGLVEDSSTKQKKKTKTKSRQKNKEDIAPGGFLSSDINLFQNPIPDDWICLFCQYDILFSGLTEARKKNGYYRRKKERSRRAREAELRRMGSLCYSDVEHDT